MNVRNPLRLLAALALGTGLAVAAGCGDDNGPTGPSAVTTVPPPPAVTTGMTTALQSEYKTQFTYQRVLTDFGAVQPFATIVLAEQSHVSSIAGLFASRGLMAPASTWTLSNVPAFATVREACAAAAAEERQIVAMYDSLLLSDLPNDARMVYTNLRAASQNNHLPAFVACS
jgi:hypothetical protein